MSDNTQTNTEQANEPASVKTYLLTFGALMVLTFLTVFVSRGVHLGALSLPVALAIASVKFLLVLLIFMHVWHESKLIILLLVATTFFMSLFFGMTAIDVRSRGIGNPMEATHYFREVNNISVINKIIAADEAETKANAKDDDADDAKEENDDNADESDDE